MDYDEYDALIQHIYIQTSGDNWIKPEEDSAKTGVCLRVDTGAFRVFPYGNDALIPFENAVRGLNPAVAVKVRTAAVQACLSKVTQDDYSMYVDGNTSIQILDTIEDLPHAEKDQCAAFIRDEGTLIIWEDHLDNILPLCKEFEEKFIKLVWRMRRPNRGVSTNSIAKLPYSPGSAASSQVALDEKDGLESQPTLPTAPPPKRRWWNWRSQPPSLDAEKGPKEERKLMMLGPLYAGIGGALALYFVGAGVSILLGEYRLDGQVARFGLCATLPLIFCVSLFFCLQLIGNLSLILGPVAQYHENSMYYSAIKPGPNPEVDNNLPHITIQMPVYKESLEQTIAPSVYSVKKAMQMYARQGGTSAIFICDDGMQVLGDEDREARVAFYANHNIGWVSRPGHSSAPDGFKRAGKFKKASNMNYGLALSLKLEKHLAELEAAGVTSEEIGESLEDRAMTMAAEEIYQESGERFRPWCSNGKSLRMGEIILIIDSDTVVPEDCFRDAAREMGEAHDVAIIQHESEVMQVAHHYFENGITHFTRRINKCISLGCANGEVAPFVGHNAFLRWSAVQDAAFVEDGKMKQWSENNVSEDFDLALRLLLKGYTLRWATYSNGGFKEGVSLTVVDELARWQKYAYGCDEIIFNPLVRWLKGGPISKQLRTFVWSNAPVHYKIGMMSYMFSYYGIAAAAVGSVVNYLVLGLCTNVDKFYVHSFEILLACAIVFPGIGNVGFTFLEYRLGHRSLSGSLVENLRWVPFFFFFFGGMSIHLSTALLAHLCSYDMTWGSTGKEVEKSTFWIEVPRIFRRFWLTIFLCSLSIAMMFTFTTDLVPLDWQIAGGNWPLIIPLALVVGSHMLLPIVLNPWLMFFSY